MAISFLSWRLPPPGKWTKNHRTTDGKTTLCGRSVPNDAFDIGHEGHPSELDCQFCRNAAVRMCQATEVVMTPVVSDSPPEGDCWGCEASALETLIESGETEAAIDLVFSRARKAAEERKPKEYLSALGKFRDKLDAAIQVMRVARRDGY